MSRDVHWRGQTTVAVGEDGTDFVGSFDPAARKGSRSRKSPRDRQPSAQEVAKQEAQDQEQFQRDVRSFVSMCVASWIKGELTQANPKPPRGLSAQVKSVGGNIKWLTATNERQAHFHRVVCRQVGREVPFANVWRGRKGP